MLFDRAEPLLFTATKTHRYTGIVEHANIMAAAPMLNDVLSIAASGTADVVLVLGHPASQASRATETAWAGGASAPSQFAASQITRLRDRGDSPEIPRMPPALAGGGQRGRRRLPPPSAVAFRRRMGYCRAIIDSIRDLQEAPS
jgi:hypothetical protein